MITVSGHVDMEFDPNELDDADLLQCVVVAQKRGLCGPDGGLYERDYVVRAHEALSGNRSGAALALLDRALFPLRLRS